MWVLLTSYLYLVEFTWVNELIATVSTGFRHNLCKKKNVYILSIISPIILYIIFFFAWIVSKPCAARCCRMYKQVWFTIFKYMYQYPVNRKSFSLLFQRTIWADMQEGSWNSWFDHNERCSYRSVRVCSRGTGSDQTSGVSKWRRLVWILWTTRGTNQWRIIYYHMYKDIRIRMSNRQSA